MTEINNIEIGGFHVDLWLNENGQLGITVSLGDECRDIIVPVNLNVDAVLIG